MPRSVEDLAELRRRVRAAGYPDQVASGIVGWLVDKAADDPDHTSAPTRSKYRKILAELEPLHDPEGDRRPLEVVGAPRNGGRRQRGHGVRKTLVAMVVMGASLGGIRGSQQSDHDASRTQKALGAENEKVPSSGRRRRGSGLRRAA